MVQRSPGDSSLRIEYGYNREGDLKSISSIERINRTHTVKKTSRISSDYKKDTITDLADGKVTPTGLPASNVLYYELEDDAWVCVRPSGTEPKVKFYYGIKGTSLEEADAKSESIGKEVLAMIEKML